MRKIKKGYTLVEVLVALTIVGVISAILIPNISNNIQDRQSAANLAKVIAQIENGNQDLIQYVNAQQTDGSYTDVLATIKNKDLGDDDTTTQNNSVLLDLPKNVKSFWGLDGVKATINPSPQDFSGNSSSETMYNTAGDIYHFSKISAGVSIIPASPAITSDVTGDDTDCTIYVDTNGWTVKPNRVGKDIFSFKLLNNGKLIPNIPDSGTPPESGEYAKKVIEAGFRIDY